MDVKITEIAMHQKKLEMTILAKFDENDRMIKYCNYNVRLLLTFKYHHEFFNKKIDDHVIN